jgi:ribosomal protein S12 methylthiotransferase
MDVPLQHASAAVLKRMRRGAGSDVFLQSIEKMRRIVPGITLRTTVITGFPGETERDFAELCDFVQEAQFDWLGAFGYSDQEGAKAHDLDAKVPPREIERRRKHLMQIQKQISRRKKKTLIGKEFDLLLEGPSEESDLLWQGRTAMHAPEIDGTVLVNDAPEGTELQAGTFYRCRISKTMDYDLVASIL